MIYNKYMQMIKTGATALYKQDLISYSPKKENVEMLFGTNTKRYSKKYKISLQKNNTFEIGVIEIEGEYYYCPERLFIEMAKFKLEATIKKEALTKLEKTINPYLVKKYYEKLKNKRRGLNKKLIEEFLDKRLLRIKEKIKEHKDKKMVIREYIMALVSTKDIPVSIIKGGSSIELFTNINRTTLDIDLHTSSNSIPEIIDFLKDKNRDIYFKLSSSEEINIVEKIKNDKKSKKTVNLNLVPISKGGVLSEELKNIVIKVTFNTTYNEQKIKDIINDYQISKKQLKILNNSSCLVFTREMLLAEKFQSIISKPSKTTRTKDLIDLKLLWPEKIKEINFNNFRKWLFRKWKAQRNSAAKDKALKIIENNKELELTKIKDNFNDAIAMYEMNTTFKECYDLYKILINESLKL